MAVSEMKKFTLLLRKKDVNRVLKKLMWTGSVEVTDAERDALSSIRSEYASELTEYIRKAGQIEDAMRSLKEYAPSSAGLFAKPKLYLPTVFDNAEEGLEKGLAMADEVSLAVNALASAQTKRVLLKEKIEALKPWLSYDLPLNIQGSQRTKLMHGTLPVKAAEETVSAMLDGVSDRYTLEWMDADKNLRYLWLLTDRDQTEQIQAELLPLGFNRLNFTEYGEMTAVEAIASLTERYKTECDSISAEKDKLTKLGEQIEVLRLAHDLAQNLFDRAEAKQKLICTESVAMLSGWVPAKALSIIEGMLVNLNNSDTCVCAWQFAETAEGEDAPILLQNGKISSCFEPIVAMYSLPAYKTLDPTKIMSIFYFIIFGLMFGDAIYGLILVLVGLLLPKYLNLSTNTRKLFNMFGICGFSSMISGILFGSYFGNMLVSVFGIKVPPILFDIVGIDALPGLIDPLNRFVSSLSAAMTFLIFAIIIGATHLFVGMGVKFYVLCKEGKLFNAIVEVGSWYLIFTGIALAFMITTPIPGMTMIAIGILPIVFFHAKDTKNPIMRFLKGLLGLYDIVNYLSDLMSYSRIMALGLSSAIIAMVVNMLAKMVGGSVIGLIFLPIVLIVGHLINIALNLLGTFVHTSRLQYIEFFGKFYVDGGRQFKPLAVNPAYTGIIIDEIKKQSN